MQTFIHEQTRENKNCVIQFFRALAIITVVMIHTTPGGEWQVICRPFINFSVATFLFLSGYLTKTGNNNWKAFCKKRIFRVIIPYLFWTILYSLPAIKYNGIESLIKNIITAKASVPLYYIFVYIQFVLLTPLLSKLAKSKYQYIGWLISPISILIFKYYNLLTGTELNGYIKLLWSDSCLGWFTFYYLGLLLGNGIIKRNFSSIVLTILYTLSIFVQIAEGYGWFLLGDSNCGTQLKLSSLLTSSLFLLYIYTILINGTFNTRSKFLILLGDYSFGIYLSHMMILRYSTLIPFYKHLPYPINSAIIILISLLCCIIGYRILGKRISGWLGLR